MDRISRQVRCLKNAERKLAVEKRELQNLHIAKRKSTANHYIKKLINAGKIFDEAGILDNYSHDAALKALQTLKREDS